MNNEIKDRINSALSRSLTNRRAYVEVRVDDLGAVMRDARATAPVPPAGDVEALEVWKWTVNGMVADPEYLQYSKKAFVRLPVVTRLTAERDTERKFRLAAEGGWREANRVIAMQRAKLDEQEAELAKLKDQS